MFVFRSRLRQKNVYIYVTSTLVANALYGLLAVYQMTVVPSGIEGNPVLPYVKAYYLKVQRYSILNKKILALIIFCDHSFIRIKFHSSHFLKQTRLKLTCLNTHELNSI